MRASWNWGWGGKTKVLEFLRTSLVKKVMRWVWFGYKHLGVLLGSDCSANISSF